MCSLTSGAHNAGLYSLNYDIDYSYINYNPVGLQGTLARYNALNAIAYGFPYHTENPNLRPDVIKDLFSRFLVG
jgi:hypothetical protein